MDQEAQAAVYDVSELSMTEQLILMWFWAAKNACYIISVS